MSWRHMEFAPRDGTCILAYLGEVDRPTDVVVIRWERKVGWDTPGCFEPEGGGPFSDTPLCWKPLPDEPTKEELAAFALPVQWNIPS